MAAVGLHRFGAPLIRPARKLLLPRWSTAAGAAQSQEVPVSDPETKVTRLSNGLTVASQDNKDFPTCTVGLWIDSGSRFETRETNGVANFVERMLVKGTKRQEVNAYTSREQTAYYARVLPKDLPQAVDTLSDMVQNSTLDEKEIEKERGIILKDIQKLQTKVEEAVFEHLHFIAYQDTPMSWPTLGTSENVVNISRKDLADYISTHYTAPRMVLAAAGGVNHEALVSLAEKRFSGLSSNKHVEVAPCWYTGSEVRIRDDDMPYAHVVLAVEGVGWTHPNYIPMMIARQLVDNWDRSVIYDTSSGHFPNRLVRNISPSNGARSFMSFNRSYTDTGLWGIYFVADRMHIEDFVWNIKEEWHRIRTGASHAEVARAKNALKQNLLKQLDSSTPVCDDIGRQMLAYGRRIPLSEWYDRIEQVDAKAVTKAMDEHMWDKCPVVVGIGPIEQLPEYIRLRGDMKWRRL
ncbi:mitochondrial-processing peptidase subunit beta-like [Dysidea avara]|uniref:mitochondrial-processing peptidase subunit beta-like n=1 Tax=Dysidea avara TaxID=196820 RepID=UPI0033177EF3